MAKVWKRSVGGDGDVFVCLRAKKLASNSKWNGKETEHKIARKIIAFIFSSLTPGYRFAFARENWSWESVVNIWPEINLFLLLSFFVSLLLDFVDSIALLWCLVVFVCCRCCCCCCFYMAVCINFICTSSFFSIIWDWINGTFCILWRATTICRPVNERTAFNLEGSQITDFSLNGSTTHSFSECLQQNANVKINMRIYLYQALLCCSHSHSASVRVYMHGLNKLLVANSLSLTLQD